MLRLNSLKKAKEHFFEISILDQIIRLKIFLVGHNFSHLQKI